jgi:hypothetical protein
MPVCIFCEDEDLPEDCKKCPICDLPPFSGMMFDPKKKETADRLEAEGDLNGAWEILSDEWASHTDIDYYDDEMAIKINSWIYELFQRHPGMTEQRVEKKIMEFGSHHFWGQHDDAIEAAEEAMRIAREGDRPDLELEALERHGSIQSQRYGGIQNMPQYEDYLRYKKILKESLQKKS